MECKGVVGVRVVGLEFGGVELVSRVVEMMVRAYGYGWVCVWVLRWRCSKSDFYHFSSSPHGFL